MIIIIINNKNFISEQEITLLIFSHYDKWQRGGAFRTVTKNWAMTAVIFLAIKWKKLFSF